MIDAVMDRKWHAGVCAINAGRTRIDQILDAMVSAALQDVTEANQIGLNASLWILQRIAHPGLCSEVDDAPEAPDGK